jgi:hypothetical protein
LIQAHNRCPHNLSRGGYELLEEKMMHEKLKQRQESIEDSSAPPSPPKRHEKWIRARQKSSGEYTSEETHCIADKIVSKMQLFTYRSSQNMVHTTICRTLSQATQLSADRWLICSNLIKCLTCFSIGVHLELNGR